MNREVIDESLMAVARHMPPYSPFQILEVLLDEYRKQHHAWPDSTKQVVIGVLAVLTKHLADTQDSAIAASAALNSIKSRT
jgi:hypothetical protein